MTRSEHIQTFRSRLMTYALVTIGAVGLAFAALDDITTDSAVRFPVERTALAFCAVWFLILAWRLVQNRHRILGGLSFGAVAIAALVQPAVGPGVGPFAYLATFGALVWFVVLAAILAVRAWRSGNRHETKSAMDRRRADRLGRALRNERTAAHQAALKGNNFTPK